MKYIFLVLINILWYKTHRCIFSHVELPKKDTVELYDLKKKKSIWCILKSYPISPLMNCYQHNNRQNNIWWAQFCQFRDQNNQFYYFIEKQANI